LFHAVWFISQSAPGPCGDIGMGFQVLRVPPIVQNNSDLLARRTPVHAAAKLSVKIPAGASPGVYFEKADFRTEVAPAS